MSDQPVVLEYSSADAGQPPGSRIRAEHGTDGVTFVVPPEISSGGVFGLLLAGALILLGWGIVASLLWGDEMTPFPPAGLLLLAAAIPVVAIDGPQRAQDSTSGPSSPDNSPI